MTTQYVSEPVRDQQQKTRRFIVNTLTFYMEFGERFSLDALAQPHNKTVNGKHCVVWTWTYHKQGIGTRFIIELVESPTDTSKGLVEEIYITLKFKGKNPDALKQVYAHVVKLMQEFGYNQVRLSTDPSVHYSDWKQG